jgi:hypothetical protein
MKFYYENSCGDKGYFSEDNLVKAIYTAWNIEADLYLLSQNFNRKNQKYPQEDRENCTLVFCPVEGNEFNCELLEPYGYKMEDGEELRDIIEIKTGKVVKYDWSEVKQLI